LALLGELFLRRRLSMIRIFIADDHPIVRNGLKQIISEQADMQVVGEAISGDALLLALSQGLPDVLLCDMSMPGRSGIELIKVVKAKWPELPLLVLSIHEDDMYAVQTIKAGAMGYLTKACPSEQLLAAIRRVFSGRLYINQDVAEKLALQMIGSEKLPHSVLSDREHQVFVMMAEGMTVSEIARQLHRSVKTISTHKTNIMQKMSFNNMADLIRYAIEHSLVNVPAGQDSGR
jgi:DNA-binding NarL/FixJ family response regulator